MNQPVDIPATLRSIASVIAELPGAESLRVFGSASTQQKRPADLDMVIWAPNGLSTTQRQLAKQVLSLARVHYGWLDVFVWDGTSLFVRNDMATAYVYARNSRRLLRAIRADGKSLQEVMNRWSTL